MNVMKATGGRQNAASTSIPPGSPGRRFQLEPVEEQKYGRNAAYRCTWLRRRRSFNAASATKLERQRHITKTSEGLRP